MSLISQNAVSRDRIKSKREDKDDPLQLMENTGIEDGKGSGLDSVKSKKRKKQEEQLEIEEEKERKKLENFLFGSFYSPVEFGKEDEEKFQDKDENGSAFFFTDRSANSVLSVYEENADFTDSDEEESKETKAVWVDDEEEKTLINIGKANRLKKLRNMKLNPGTE